MTDTSEREPGQDAPTAAGAGSEAERLVEKAAQDLGWTELLDRIARGCMGAVAADLLRQLRPAPTLEEARVRMTRVAEAIELGEHGHPLPACDVEDLAPVVERLRRGAVASGLELRALIQQLRAARELRSYVEQQAAVAPLLALHLTSDPELDRLEQRLLHAIEPDGTVADRASTELRQARQRVAEARRELTRRLNELVARYSEVLRGGYYAEREGRYVLPVRADAHFRVAGIVLGASSSGGTLYVEPQEVTALANRLMLHIAEEEREVQRVLAELSGAAREHAEAILTAQDALLLADGIAAIVRWAGGARARPVVVSDQSDIVLLRMRHPLLLDLGFEVVPNDLELAAGTALVISGPNAGGKTVALKSLGIAVWMARAGIPIPALPESRVGWFEPVLTDIGDEQSLARSLSTFSAHVANLRAILERAGPRALVLLDELAGGTDPEEGAALATAVLEALVAGGVAVVTTTHYERLKEAAAEQDRFRNASVSFDFEAMAPTFRLTLDLPGPSSALAVAQRFGISSDIVARARDLMPEQALIREGLLGQISAEREALHQARERAERDAERQARLAEELHRERATARQQERARLAREAEQLMASVREARGRLHAVEQRLRQPDLGAKELAQLQRLVDSAARPVAVGSQLAQVVAPSVPGARAARAADLTPGTVVYLKKLARRAEVLEVTPKGVVRVLAGPLKMLVPLEEIELVPANSPRPTPALDRGRGKKSQARASARHASESSGVDGFVPVRAVDNTLDLRGQRVDEALDAVEVFLDGLLNRGERVGFVLHGHGTGALKSAVRDHLRTSSYVDRSYAAEPEDGGDAYTVAWLKQ